MFSARLGQCIVDFACLGIGIRGIGELFHPGPREHHHLHVYACAVHLREACRPQIQQSSVQFWIIGRELFVLRARRSDWMPFVCSTVSMFG